MFTVPAVALMVDAVIFNSPDEMCIRDSFKLMPRGKIKKVQAAVVKGMDNSENADEVKKQLESHTLVILPASLRLS